MTELEQKIQANHLYHVDISERDIEDALERPSSFGYGGSNENMFTTWSLGPVFRHRDGDLLEQSNADALIKHLENDWPELADDWSVVGCSHWAVGWVDHLSFRAVDENNEPTIMFRVVKSWFDALSEYPVADDMDHSERVWEATMDNLESQLHCACRRYDIDQLPEDHISQLLDWFDANNPCALEDHDGFGGYPSDTAMDDALIGLGWVSDEN